MEIFQLRAFLAVAEELHFGQAAKRLGIAQPPLSRTIRQLEEHLGADLFYRTTRSVSLSPAGETLLEPARMILQTCRTAEESVRSATAGDIGRLRFGFAGPSSNRLVAQLTGAVRREKPGIALEMETSTYAAEALTRLVEGTLDLALVRWQRRPPQITGRVVMVEELVAAVPADHRLASRPELSLADLADEDLIMLPAVPRSAMRDAIFSAFMSEGVVPRIVQEAPDSWMISSLVGASAGITITYDSVIAGIHEPNLVTIPLTIRQEPTKVYLAHRTDNPIPALQEVLTVAEAALPTVG